MPGLKWSFVRRMEPLQPCEIAVDVGSVFDPDNRLFDHHHGQGPDHCSAQAVWRGRESLKPLMDCDVVTIFCHQEPDMDCAVSSFLASCLLRNKFPEEAVIKRLLDVAVKVDQGFVRPVSVDVNREKERQDDFNFYTFFLYLHYYIRIIDERSKIVIMDKAKELGIGSEWERWDELFMYFSMVFLEELLFSEHAMKSLQFVDNKNRMDSLEEYLEHAQGAVADEFRCFASYVRTQIKDVVLYLGRKVQKKEYEVFSVRLPGPGRTVQKSALHVTMPENCIPFLKGWRGKIMPIFPELKETPMDILAFTWLGQTHPRRVAVSISPEDCRSFSLKGLGLALDRANNNATSNPLVYKPENARWRRKMSNGEIEPDPLISTADPWYDGRDHDFSIVDAPNDVPNRHLTVQQIIDILKGDWHSCASEYETESYKRWLQGETAK